MNPAATPPPFSPPLQRAGGQELVERRTTLRVQLLPEVREAYLALPEADRQALSALTPEMIAFYGSLPVDLQVRILGAMEGQGALVVGILRHLYNAARHGLPAPEGDQAEAGALVPAGRPVAAAEPGIRLDPAVAELLRGLGAAERSVLAAFMAQAGGGSQERALALLTGPEEAGARQPEPLVPPALEGGPPPAPEGILAGIGPQPPALEPDVRPGPEALPPEPVRAPVGGEANLRAEAALFQAALDQEILRAVGQGESLAGHFQVHRPRVAHVLGRLTDTAAALLEASPDPQAAGILANIRNESAGVPDRLDTLGDRVDTNRGLLAAAAAAMREGRPPAHDLGALVQGMADAVRELRDVFTRVADRARELAAAAQGAGAPDVALTLLMTAKEAVIEREVLPGPGHELTAPFRIRDAVVGLAKRLKRGVSAFADRMSSLNDILGGIGLGVVSIADVITATATGAAEGFLGGAASVIGFAAAGVALFFGLLSIALAFHRIHRGEVSLERLERIRDAVSEGRGEETRRYVEGQKHRKIVLAAEGGIVGSGASIAAIVAIMVGILVVGGLTGPGAVVAAVVAGVVGLVAAGAAIWAAFFRKAEARLEADVLVRAAESQGAEGMAARSRILQHVGYPVGLGGDGTLAGQKDGKRVSASKIRKDLRSSASFREEIVRIRQEMARRLVDMLVGGTGPEQVDAEMILVSMGLQPAALRNQAATDRGAVEAEVERKLKP